MTKPASANDDVKFTLRRINFGLLFVALQHIRCIDRIVGSSVPAVTTGNTA